MANRSLRAITVGIALAVSAAVVGGHSHEATAFGEPGNPNKPARVVEIAMRQEHGKMLFVPDRVEVRRGEQIRFKLSNEDSVNHEFILGTEREIRAHAVEMKKNPDMEDADEHSLTLGMYGSGDILWRFTKRGKFVFACLIPGHLERGMKGVVIVK
jgi:uncharacterized cupredoxin-like copper-binding protein